MLAWSTSVSSRRKTSLSKGYVGHYISQTGQSRFFLIIWPWQNSQREVESLFALHGLRALHPAVEMEEVRLWDSWVQAINVLELAPSLSLTPAPGIQLPSPKKPRETTHGCSRRQPSWGTSGWPVLQPRYHMTATTCRPQCKPPAKSRQPQEPWQVIPGRDLLFSATRVACYAATDTGTNYMLSPLKASGGKVVQNYQPDARNPEYKVQLHHEWAGCLVNLWASFSLREKLGIDINLSLNVFQARGMVPPCCTLCTGNNKC